MLGAASWALGVQPSRSGAATLPQRLSAPSRGARWQPCLAHAARRGGSVGSGSTNPRAPVAWLHRPGPAARCPVLLARHRGGRRVLPPSLRSALPAARTSLLAPPPAPAPRRGEACGPAGLSMAGAGGSSPRAGALPPAQSPPPAFPRGDGGGESHRSGRTPGEGAASGVERQRAPEMCLGWWAGGQLAGSNPAACSRGARCPCRG